MAEDSLRGIGYVVAPRLLSLVCLVIFAVFGHHIIYPSYITPAVRHMLYGFGDVHVPLRQTVEVLEDVLMEFIQDIVCASIVLSSSPAISNPFYLSLHYLTCV